MYIDRLRKQTRPRPRDPFREYVELLPDGKFKCQYCGKKFASNLQRVKWHLSRTRGGGVDICSQVPEDVQLAAAEAIPPPKKRARGEGCSGKTQETSAKMVMSKDGVFLDKLLSKLVLSNDIDIDIVRRSSFVEFVNAVAEHSSHYKLPCYSVVKTKLVTDLVKEIGEHVENVKKSWDTTGCTLLSYIWRGKERSFVNIFAHSIDGMILLNALDIPIDDELTSGLLWEIVYFVTERIGANHVLQYISNSALGEGLFEILLNDNHPRIYETHCVAREIHLLLEDIYNDVEWVRKAFD